MNARLETKRWFIALAAVLIQLCLGTVYAWSVFKNELVANQGWDEVATSAAFMICIAFVGVAAGFGGVLMDKKGPRYVALLSGVFFGLGTMIGGIGVERQNIYLLYFGYGFIAGSANGFGYVTPIATLLHWFPDKRGLVTGLAVMGFGAGAFFMGKIAPAQIAAWGVAHTLYIWGAVYFILICGSALFFKNPPDGWMPEGYKPQTKTAIADARSMSFSEAIRSIQWWTLWGILVLHITAGIGLISQLAPIAKELYRPLARADISSEQLALATDAAGGLLVAIASIFNGLGRLFWAWLSDFFGRRTIFFVLLLSQAILYGVIPLVSNYYLFMLIACYVLACYGGGFATMPAFAADAFGTKNIARIYGTMLTAWSLAGVAGPLVFAYAKKTTGDFFAAIYIAAALLGLGLILLVLYKPKNLNDNLSLYPKFQAPRASVNIRTRLAQWLHIARSRN